MQLRFVVPCSLFSAGAAPSSGAARETASAACSFSSPALIWKAPAAKGWGAEQGHRKMGSYDVTREQPVLSGEIPGVKRLLSKPWGKLPWVSIVRAPHPTRSSGRRWPTVCSISFNEKRADKWWRGGDNCVRSPPGLPSVESCRWKQLSHLSPEASDGC